jgi:hypothetical protein
MKDLAPGLIEDSFCSPSSRGSLFSPIIFKLHGAFKQAMEDPGFKKTMDSFDMPIIYRNPEGLAKDMNEMSDRWGKLIREMGLKRQRDGRSAAGFI